MAEPFGSPRVFSRGVLYDSERLPGLVAERESGPVGLLQYHVDHDQWQVVVLVGVARRQGVGG